DHWEDFRIWQDANGDGISQPGEVRTLSDLGITSIGLNPSGPSQMLTDGSVIQGVSTFTWADGSTGSAGDVGLVHDSSRSLVGQPDENIDPKSQPTPDLGNSGGANPIWLGALGHDVLPDPIWRADDNGTATRGLPADRFAFAADFGSLNFRHGVDTGFDQ